MCKNGQGGEVVIYLRAWVFTKEFGAALNGVFGDDSCFGSFGLLFVVYTILLLLYTADIFIFAPFTLPCFLI